MLSGEYERARRSADGTSAGRTRWSTSDPGSTEAGFARSRDSDSEIMETQRRRSSQGKYINSVIVFTA